MWKFMLWQAGGGRSPRSPATWTVTARLSAPMRAGSGSPVPGLVRRRIRWPRSRRTWRPGSPMTRISGRRRCMTRWRRSGTACRMSASPGSCGWRARARTASRAPGYRAGTRSRSTTRRVRKCSGTGSSGGERRGAAPRTCCWARCRTRAGSAACWPSRWTSRTWSRRSTACCAGTAARRGSGGPTGSPPSSSRAAAMSSRASRRSPSSTGWWWTMTATTPAQAQASLDVFCSGTADARRRKADGAASTVGALADAEPMLALPAAPYPATVIVSRTVGANAAVAFRGNSYSVPPGLGGTAVECRHRLGTATLEIFSASGAGLSSHRLAPDGAGTLVRSAGHRAELERAVLSAFTTERPCERKGNHPPGEPARAEAVRLLAGLGPEVTVDLADWAERTPLPVGYVHDDAGDIVTDPDAGVQAAIADVFAAFAACGPAYG